MRREMLTVILVQNRYIKTSPLQTLKTVQENLVSLIQGARNRQHLVNLIRAMLTCSGAVQAQAQAQAKQQRFRRRNRATALQYHACSNHGSRRDPYEQKPNRRQMLLSCSTAGTLLAWSSKDAESAPRLPVQKQERKFSIRIPQEYFTTIDDTTGLLKYDLIEGKGVMPSKGERVSCHYDLKTAGQLITVATSRQGSGVTGGVRMLLSLLLSVVIDLVDGNDMCIHCKCMLCPFSLRSVRIRPW